MAWGDAESTTRALPRAPCARRAQPENVTLMMTPRKPPVPAEERAFGFSAQVPCQGVLGNRDVNGVNIRPLARDVRLTDKPVRRRKLGLEPVWSLRFKDVEAEAGMFAVLVLPSTGWFESKTLVEIERRRIGVDRKEPAASGLRDGLGHEIASACHQETDTRALVMLVHGKPCDLKRGHEGVIVACQAKLFPLSSLKLDRI